MAAINLGNVRGATGATGAKGDKGDKGDTGATGAKGDKGDTGATGATGAGVPSGGSAGDLLVNSAPGVGAWTTDTKVIGAASSTDNAIARFDGTTGKLVQDSAARITDAGQIVMGAGNPYGSLTLTATTGGFTGLVPNGTVGIGSIDYNNGMYAGNGFVFANSALGTTSFSMVCNDSSAFFGMLDGTGVAVKMIINSNGVGFGVPHFGISAAIDTTNIRIREGIIDSAGSSGTDGQVLKKVGGLVLWSNP